MKFIFNYDGNTTKCTSHLHEVPAAVIKALWDDLVDALPLPAREARLVVGHGGDAGPAHLVGRAQRAEDAEQLVDLAVPGEEGAPVQLKRAKFDSQVRDKRPRRNLPQPVGTLGGSLT